jgi:hypothetical protein
VAGTRNRSTARGNREPPHKKPWPSERGAISQYLAIRIARKFCQRSFVQGGEAVVLVVLNGKEGSGYAVHADSGLSELLPSILRRVAKMIGREE